MRRYAVLALLAACGTVHGSSTPADDDDPPGDDTPDTEDEGCQLIAVTPAIATTGDTVTLDGTFGDSASVTFPGGARAEATLVGAHRLTVVVPAAASAGDLTVDTCGATLGPVAFRRASFTLGLAGFTRFPDQAAGGRLATRPATPRDAHVSAVFGDSLYVIGGNGKTGALDSVERALINADGSLQKLAAVPGVSLITARRGASAQRVRDRLYVIGGYRDEALASVEHADATGGALGAFATDAAALVTARYGHASAVIGHYVYVLGGQASGVLASVERAEIRADGTLGPFAALRDRSLTTPRRGHVAVVIGGYLYVLGGADSNGLLASIERAPIAADGTLGAFEAVSGKLLDPRADFAAMAVGKALYVIGGAGARFSLGTVERAPIASDGSLGAFAALTTLSRPRQGHTLAVAGNTLHVLGGSDASGILTEDDQVSINASGALGAFASVPGLSLAKERAHTRAVVLGRWLYIIAGTGDARALERAAINPDGSLGPFGAVASVALAADRTGHATAVIGDYLYVLGSDRSVERSRIAADGTLAAFESAGVQLAISRLAPAAVVMGRYLYVIGGSDAQTSGMERAEIQADGTLGAFAAVTSPATTARFFPYAVSLASSTYLFGGSSTLADVTAVVRAGNGVSDGLGDFAASDSGAIPDAQCGAVLLGNALFALASGQALRATMDPTTGEPGRFTATRDDGLLGRFAPASASIGNYVYLAGGASGRALLRSVARAELQ